MEENVEKKPRKLTSEFDFGCGQSGGYPGGCPDKNNSTKVKKLEGIEEGEHQAGKEKGGE